MPKYGDINPISNLVFVQRGPTYPNGEYWVTRDVFENRKKSISKQRKKKAETDDNFVKRRKEKDKERRSNPEAKRKRVDRHKSKMDSDPIYAIKFLTRMRLSALSKRNGVNKSTPSRRMLGADPHVCKKFLEDQFAPGMNWQNRGDWHIDHFFPISLAKNESDVRMFSHFTNLRPLWASDNIRKNNKLPQVDEIIARDTFVTGWLKQKYELK